MQSRGGRDGVRTSVPQALLLGLYLRDAGGLRPPAEDDRPELPPLTPSIAPLRPGGEPLAGIGAASRQWARWWRGAWPGEAAALTGILPPSFPAWHGCPELQGIAHLLLDDALEWAVGARARAEGVLRMFPTALAETNLLADLESRLGRSIRPFSLPVVLLPVRGKDAWRIGGTDVVSLALRGDRDAYLDWLRRRLLELAAERHPRPSPEER
ncbi:hypothetical protein ACFFKU_07025 [Kineococcus gynurae]|uniref:Uncharacterized protein n=1 Tax=Kineococcus gynurae TaxID=452979 RepID=A0ABV5LWY3_9ACTN